MNRLSAILVLLFTTIVFFTATAGIPPQKGTAIKPGVDAPHIAGFDHDSIILVMGSTYSFSVDTPEDAGLVSIQPSVDMLKHELMAEDGSAQRYTILTRDGIEKKTGLLENGDRVKVIAANGRSSKIYHIRLRKLALTGKLVLLQPRMTIHAKRELILHYTAGQRSPDATIKLQIPPGVIVSMDNTTVNVIGRGEVKLKDLATQSIGRTGSKYSYNKVGAVEILKTAAGGSVLVFTHLDLRPANGPDLVIKIDNVGWAKTGRYQFKAIYTASQPELLTSAGTGNETAAITVSNNIADFERIADRTLQYKETAQSYSTAQFRWSSVDAKTIRLMQSVDGGKSWQPGNAKIDARKGTADIEGLIADKNYRFRLHVIDGLHKGYSNSTELYTGKKDIKSFGVSGLDNEDNTEKINAAIDSLHRMGGGVLLFSPGIYNVRTVHLKSNVYLYVEKGATIKAIKGADAPELTWFSDKKYRSGLSPTDSGPYADPENYMTKQDVGHHYFHNTMFFGERLDNVKIIGNGYITGNGNLVTGDRVMNNTPDNRADKMFTLKLCTNIEIGGIYRPEDLWYDEVTDEPYYRRHDGSKDTAVDNMLHIDRAGHFVLLATGTDNINVHDTYFGKQHTSNVRDIYDFMACNNVSAVNIYSRVSSDDIIKPGSDCSLGFTRPAAHYKVRNVIGDTNCNLFQVGSETADDITDIHVDNIYILGANKAGFSISTNDGAHIKDIHLNCGHTGTIHSRSKMYRSFSPFFISISNRGRIIGAEVGKYSFSDNGEKHNELLVKNVNIGKVENILLNGIDVAEVYAGSSYSGKRWKSYDGTQKRATPIVAGYSLPDTKQVEGGLDFRLPNGLHTGYIKNVSFNDVHILVKGGNASTDTSKRPPELGVGQYNVSNLGVQPSFGIWARHVEGLSLTDCNFNYEQGDGRYAIFLDDVKGASIHRVQAVITDENKTAVKLHNSSGVTISQSVIYQNKWNLHPVEMTIKKE